MGDDAGRDGDHPEPECNPDDETSLHQGYDGIGCFKLFIDDYLYYIPNQMIGD